jgi:xanthine phosphoribosyltransferase
MSDVFIDWKTIQVDAEELAKRLKDDGKEWKGIIAVTRGGMVPACLIARELGIQLIETFCVATYDNTQQRDAEIAKSLDLPDKGENWLVIDDLVDSGDTFEIIRHYLPKAYYATLYAKPKGAELSDKYIRDYEQDAWIHFPWETNPEDGSPKGY